MIKVAFQLLTDVGGLMFNIFGAGAILSLVVIGMIILLLLKAQANISVILVVLIPVVVGLILNEKTTNFIYATGWIIMPIVIALAFIFAFLLIIVLR